MEKKEKFVIDENNIENYSTGAIRKSCKGKGRYDLLSPLAIARLAKVFENGAEFHGDRNWEKGLNMARFMDSAFRHMYQYLEGRRDEDHLAHAFWNISAALHTEEAINRGLLPKELYDLPNYVAEKKE